MSYPAGCSQSIHDAYFGGEELRASDYQAEIEAEARWEMGRCHPNFREWCNSGNDDFALLASLIDAGIFGKYEAADKRRAQVLDVIDRIRDDYCKYRVATIDRDDLAFIARNA